MNEKLQTKQDFGLNVNDNFNGDFAYQLLITTLEHRNYFLSQFFNNLNHNDLSNDKGIHLMKKHNELIGGGRRRRRKRSKKCKFFLISNNNALSFNTKLKQLRILIFLQLVVMEHSQYFLFWPSSNLFSEYLFK